MSSNMAEHQVKPSLTEGRIFSHRQKAGAYLVHVYTATGAVFAFLAAIAVCAPEPDPRLVFLWLGVQVLVDATDGPLARALDVKNRAARIAGRTMDDIIDFITYTFIPLLLVWRMQWLPGPELAWVIPALLASLLAFANTTAKQEAEGFFLGFPSYWNLYAFYAGLWAMLGLGWLGALMLVVFTVLSVTPVRFLYPNLAPRPWRAPLLVGAALWAVLLAVLLVGYHEPQRWAWLMWLSLLYPAAYVALSIYLDVKDRRAKAEA